MTTSRFFALSYIGFLVLAAAAMVMGHDSSLFTN